MKRAGRGNRVFRDRLRQIAGRSADAEFEVEHEFHVEQQVRDLIRAGVDPTQARVEAERMFGDVESIRSAVRRIEGESRMGEQRPEYASEFTSDVRYAFRQLEKRLTHNLVTVAVVALGVGAAVTVFTYVDRAFLQPLPFPDEAQVYRLFETQDPDRTSASYPDFKDWEREAGPFQAMTAFYSGSAELQLPDGPSRIITLWVAGDPLAVAGLSPVIGRGFSFSEEADDDGSVILSHGFWRDAYGGSTSVIGESIRINDRAHTIVGVAPADADLLFHRSDAAVWMPMIERSFMSRGLHFLRVVARANPGLSPEAVEEQTSAMAQGLIDTEVTEHGAAVQPFRETLTGDLRTPLLILAGAVSLLVTIMCVNLASLSLANSSRRMPEYAVRLALGAGRSRIGRMLLTETLVIGLIGGGLGLVGATQGLRWLAALPDAPTLFGSLSLDGRALGFGLALALATGVIFGLGAVFAASRTGLLELLGGSSGDRATERTSVKRQRRFLVGLEAGICVVLLVGGALLVRSTTRLLSQDPGFDPNDVVSVEVPLSTARYPEDADRVSFFETLVERVAASPESEAVGIGSHVPLSGNDTNGSFRIYGKDFPEDAPPQGKKRLVGPGYFEAVGIPVLAGRALDERDRAGEQEVVVISKAFADKYWPDQDPLGESLCYCFGGDTAQVVVGIVGDIRHDGLDLATEGTVYMSHTQNARANLTLFARARSNPAALTDEIRRTIGAIDPQQPAGDVAPLESVLLDSVGRQRALMAVVGLFGLAALALAAVGIYAVTAHSAGRRRGEMGIRMALGADRGEVLRLVVRDELAPVALGLFVGLIGAVGLSRFLEAMLFEVSALDPASYGVASAVLFGIALVATLLPARKAAGLDPVEALRAE